MLYKHSEFVTNLFTIEPYATSDLTLNGIKFEFKETEKLRKFNGYFYFVYSFHAKDCNAHDYIVFFNHVTKLYRIVPASLLSISSKPGSYINETMVQKQQVFVTNNPAEVKDKIVDIVIKERII